MFGLMTNIVQFAYWNCQKKRKKEKTHWGMYKPCYVLMLATVMVLAQPCCMLYIGSWICDGQFSADQIDFTVDGASSGVFNAQGLFIVNGTAVCHEANKPAYCLFTKDTFYVDGCHPSQGNFFFDGGVSNALVPNTTVGWCIQIFGTYLGFIVMFVGVCQATLLHERIMKKWKALRRSASTTPN